MNCTAQQFSDILDGLKGKVVAFDFETTGLNPYRGDRAFMVSIAWRDGDIKAATYFFEHASRDTDLMHKLCNTPKMLLAHNAKFEMHFLKAQFDQTVTCPIWDTMVMDRIRYNDHMSYSLDNCGQREGLKKIDVKEIMDKEKLFTKRLDGKKDYHFDRLPAHVLTEYCENDAIMSLQLYHIQSDTFRLWDATDCPIRGVIKLEVQTTKHLFDMEHRGLLLDMAYTEAAWSHEQRAAMDAKRAIEQMTGKEFVDSAKAMADSGLKAGQTAAGRASYSADVLESDGSPLAKAMLAYRHAAKRAETYFGNFLELATDSVIHPSIFQNGAASGRFSVRDPSCQNWPSEWNEGTNSWDVTHPVRRCFVAQPECKIVSLDFAQMELRKMADEAREERMIDAFINGEDFHQSLADLAGCSRSLGKRMRFLRLYGGGVAKAAKTLGITETDARRICDALDMQTPGIKRYVRSCIRYAEQTGWGSNFLGRRYHFGDRFAYKFPNYRIQGGCSDILRQSIRNVAELLAAEAKGNTYQMLPIHDELVLNVDECDMHLIPKIRLAMLAGHTDMYRLPMDASVSVGVNFADLERYRNDV